MLKRYRRTAEGAPRVTANVYLLAEHGIGSAAIDAGAAGICQRLVRAGHETYIVGGAVRDLLTGRRPKDFDIATSARPRQVAGLFRGARVIGRRFKLVHVPSGARVFEVATFRGPDRTTANRYGTMDQDAFRRDFTFNALYYAPRSERLIDYVGGFEDIKRRTLHTIGTPEGSFIEDPVRMIRAAKYARLAGFTMERRYRVLISRQRRTPGRVLGGAVDRGTGKDPELRTGGADPGLRAPPRAVRGAAAPAGRARRVAAAQFADGATAGWSWIDGWPPLIRSGGRASCAR